MNTSFDVIKLFGKELGTFMATLKVGETVQVSLQSSYAFLSLAIQGIFSWQPL